MNNLLKSGDILYSKHHTNRLCSNILLKNIGYRQEEIQTIIDKYFEPHRYYHNIDHLKDLLRQIDEANVTPQDKLALEVTALFHDAIYIPDFKNNELLSARFLKYNGKPRMIEFDTVINTIYNTIIDTKTHKARSEFSEVFCKMDINSLVQGSGVTLIQNEIKLFKEFQKYSFSEYKKGRKEFLNKFNAEYPIKSIETNLEFLDNWVPKIGIYAGSFNPFHIGHLNILEKAERIFDKVVIGLGTNFEKTERTASERKKQVSNILPFHEIIEYSGLLTEVVHNYINTGCAVTLIRGLRNGYDLQYEANMLRFIQDISPLINVVYFYADIGFEHISSSAVRSLETFEIYKAYIPTKYDYFNDYEKLKEYDKILN